MAYQLALFSKDLLVSALQPLRELLKKSNKEFVMSDLHAQLFERAKCSLKSENVLAYFRHHAPLQLIVHRCKFKKFSWFCVNATTTRPQLRPVIRAGLRVGYGGYTPISDKKFVNGVLKKKKRPLRFQI